jgi:hypothetical protein
MQQACNAIVERKDCNNINSVDTEKQQRCETTHEHSLHIGAKIIIKSYFILQFVIDQFLFKDMKSKKKISIKCLNKYKHSKGTFTPLHCAFLCWSRICALGRHLLLPHHYGTIYLHTIGAKDSMEVYFLSIKFVIPGKFMSHLSFSVKDSCKLVIHFA